MEIVKNFPLTWKGNLETIIYQEFHFEVTKN